VIGAAVSIASGAVLVVRPNVRRACVRYGHRMARRVFIIVGQHASWDSLRYQAWLRDHAGR
jgi:hypothetical protein